MTTTREKQSVLIVDDMPENIDILRGILKQNYKLKIATDGAKALKIAGGQQKPDIILLDIMMPSMDGYEVCEKLKQDPATQSIPVIFITARTNAEDEQRGFDMGAVDYILKPFNSVIVETRVRTQLSKVWLHLVLYFFPVRMKKYFIYERAMRHNNSSPVKS